MFTGIIQDLATIRIKEIFISAADPDVRTNYKSIKKLKKNNVIVNVG